MAGLFSSSLGSGVPRAEPHFHCGGVCSPLVKTKTPWLQSLVSWRLFVNLEELVKVTIVSALLLRMVLILYLKEFMR